MEKKIPLKKAADSLTPEQRIKAAILGGLVADAACMGLHWYGRLQGNFWLKCFSYDLQASAQSSTLVVRPVINSLTMATIGSTTKSSCWTN